MIVIDKNVPFPPSKANKRYPLNEMEIGDSFFVASDRKLFEGSGALHAQRPKKFTVRRTTEKDTPGFRVWRVA